MLLFSALKYNIGFYNSYTDSKDRNVDQGSNKKSKKTKTESKSKLNRNKTKISKKKKTNSRKNKTASKAKFKKRLNTIPVISIPSYPITLSNPLPVSSVSVTPSTYDASPLFSTSGTYTGGSNYHTPTIDTNRDLNYQQHIQQLHQLQQRLQQQQQQQQQLPYLYGNSYTPKYQQPDLVVTQQNHEVSSRQQDFAPQTYNPEQYYNDEFTAAEVRPQQSDPSSPYHQAGYSYAGDPVNGFRYVYNEERFGEPPGGQSVMYKGQMIDLPTGAAGPYEAGLGLVEIYDPCEFFEKHILIEQCQLSNDSSPISVVQCQIFFTFKLNEFCIRY